MRKLLYLFVLVSCKSTIYYKTAYNAVQYNLRHQPIIITDTFEDCRVEMINSRGKVFWADLCDGQVGDTVKIQPGIMPGQILKVN